MNKNYIYMPNEMFDDLQREISSISHIAFAYSYYFLTNYLYRYCEYAEKRFTQSDLKEILGYSRVDKRIDYIIKKNGTLDQMGYTITTNEYPQSYGFDEYGNLYFETYSNEFYQSVEKRNYKIKYPLKSFHRTGESYNNNLLDGTFFDLSNTHNIQYSKFEEMIKNKDLGVVGFFVYAYLKHKADIYGSYQCPYPKLIEDLGIKSNQTLSKYIKNLEQEKHIAVRRIIHPNNREANLYTIL